MNILIIGKSGVGKSNLADLLKNLIFKMDKQSNITINDPDREVKQFGSGISCHTITVVRDKVEANEFEYDIEIEIKTNQFKDWFDKL
jgi:dephospho-CoA kinase